MPYVSLNEYVGWGDFNRRTVVTEMLNEVQDSCISLSQNPNSENAERLCRATRGLYLAVMDFNLSVGDPEDIPRLSPVLDTVVAELKSACERNPDNAEFIRRHLDLAQRIKRYINDLSVAQTLNNNVKAVFISYVSEDHETVVRLRDGLLKNEIETWLDRDNLVPGLRWKTSIRDAISNGQCFIAVFSEHYLSRSKTYMNDKNLHLQLTNCGSGLGIERGLFPC